jgi:hypothetical protein
MLQNLCIFGYFRLTPGIAGNILLAFPYQRKGFSTRISECFLPDIAEKAALPLCLARLERFNIENV